MSVVDLNRQKANYAESIALQMLSRQCLVRPVAAGTDIGIDLYCEAVIGEAPFQHFWVQVKAIGKGNFATDGTPFYDFETKHLRYWVRQPVPVFAFLVPVTDWPPSEPEYVYGLRITDILVRQGIPNQEYVRYKSTEGFSRATVDKDLEKFVRVIVPNDYATLQVPRGLVAPIEQVESSTQASFPKLVLLPHLDAVVSGIRFAAEICLAELVDSHSAHPKDVSRRHLLRGILELYPEAESTMIGMTGVANAAFADGDRATSSRFLRRARAKLSTMDLDEDSRARGLAELDTMLRIVEG